MKKIYLIIILVLLNSTLYADGVQSLTTGVPVSGGSFPHFDPLSGSKISANNHFRLIAKTYTQYNGSWFQPLDSNSYVYGVGRGSLIDPDQPNNDEFILFDQATTYYYNTGISGYKNKMRRTQTFDADNKIQSLTYARWNTLTSSPAWKDSARYLYSYVTGTKKIDASVFQLYVGGTWAHDISSQLTYNGNNVVSVSSVDYNATYTYDANNNITSIVDKVSNSHGGGTLTYNERKTFTYTTSNDIATYMVEKWDINASSWVKQQYWEYTYAGKNIDVSVEHKWDGSAWVKYSQHSYTYNSNNDQLTEITKLWNATSGVFVESTFEKRDYNIHGLVETLTISEWDKASGSWKYNSSSYQTRYYYEYFNPTSINHLTSKSGLTIYPNPATDNIHIAAAFSALENADISIYNALGVCVFHSSEQKSGELKKDINISNLPAGSYSLLVSAGNDKLSDKILIIK